MEASQGVFMAGFIAGMLFSAYFGWVLRRIQYYRNAANAPNRPMAVLTERTPSQVTRQAARASVSAAVWVLILVTSAFVSLYMAYALM